MSRLIIALGNPLCGDDGVGAAVAKALAPHLPPDRARLIRHEGEGLGLLSLWEEAEAVILIDAAVGLALGEVRRINALHHPLAEETGVTSTHAFGVQQALDMGRALDMLPGSLIVFAVGGAAFEPGDPLSPAVAAAVPRVVEAVLAEITR